MEIREHLLLAEADKTKPEARKRPKHQTLPRGIWVDQREACRLWTRGGHCLPRPLHRLTCKTRSLCFPFIQ